MPSAPLLARRREVVALVIAAAIGTIVLGFHYAGRQRAGRIDHALDLRIQHRLSGHLRFLEHLIRLGDPSTVVAICVVLAAVFFFTGRRKAALLAVFGPAVAAGFTEFVLKPLIDRRLNDSLSFPSGHTTGAVSVAVVIVVVLMGPNRPPWPIFVRVVVSVLALLEAAAVATALIGSGYHYTTDTVGGFCVAIGMVLTVALAIDELAERRRTDTSA